MVNDFSVLYAQFKEILDAGTEDQAETFLIDHMHEFPEEMQKAVTMALFEKGLGEAAANQKTIDDMREGGMQALDEIQGTIAAIDDRTKVIELEEKMK